jgi:hypothetical protein
LKLRRASGILRKQVWVFSNAISFGAAADAAPSIKMPLRMAAAQPERLSKQALMID